MPIAIEDTSDYIPSSLVEKVHQTQPHVVSPANITPIVDTRYEPLSSLLQYVDGSSWVVDYFSQLVTQSSEASPQQPNQHPVYQQYINIKNLELRVTSALAYLQDSNTNETILTGTATLYPGVVANEGDMFTGDVGDGRLGVFLINDVTRKTQLLETCYEINYSFTGYADNHRQLLADLQVKTVQVDYFVKDLIGKGSKPYLAEEQVVTLDRLKRCIKELVGLYFGKFFDREYRTLIVPEMAESTYDSFLIKALTSMLDVEDHTLMRGLKTYNVDGAEAINNLTIWDIVLGNSIDLMPVATTRMWLVGTQNFNKWPLLGSIYHSRINSAVFPLNHTPGLVESTTAFGLPMYDITVSPDATIPPIDVTAAPTANPDGTLILPPSINSVRTHDRYVLSNYFYNQAEVGQSILELMVSNYLAQKPSNPLHLLNIYDDVKNWSPLDQFYQIPVLLVLMKIATRRF